MLPFLPLKTAAFHFLPGGGQLRIVNNQTKNLSDHLKSLQDGLEETEMGIMSM